MRCPLCDPATVSELGSNLLAAIGMWHIVKVHVTRTTVALAEAFREPTPLSMTHRELGPASVCGV